MPTHFDCVVVGAGPGGYVAAIRLSQLGKKVAIVEKKYWGGVCLNVGCIPSKALLRHAEIAHLLGSGRDMFGIEGEASLSYQKAVERSRQVSDGRVKGIHYLMKKNGITEFSGEATFLDAHRLSVALEDGSQEELAFDGAIIATGAVDALLPGVSLGQRIVTYETQILQTDVPDTITIVGAGPIGVEFSYLLASFGSTVTLIEYADRVLPNEDPAISREIARSLSSLGVKVLVGHSVQEITETAEAAKTQATCGDETLIVESDVVMVAIGFRPRIDGYGLENTGVCLTDKGAIDVDHQMRTNVEHLFAIGDVTAKMSLAHVAETQGVIAAETLAGKNPTGISDYRFMPRAVFAHPEVASFGLTEQQATSEGFEASVVKFPFMANGKAHALADATGFIQLVVDNATRTLLGAHLVGPHVAELLPELTLAHSAGLTVDQLNLNVHIHPTLSEAVQEAIHGAAGHMINF
jgi:dihydrolipoamide dehydrogenase